MPSSLRVGAASASPVYTYSNGTVNLQIASVTCGSGPCNATWTVACTALGATAAANFTLTLPGESANITVGMGSGDIDLLARRSDFKCDARLAVVDADGKKAGSSVASFQVGKARGFICNA